MTKKLFTVSSRDSGNIKELVGKVININNLEESIDEGDCCGYADIGVLKNTFEGDVLITNIETEDDYDGDSESVLVTFYGANKQIYQANLYDGSGSGWDYGAVATLSVKLVGK